MAVTMVVIVTVLVALAFDRERPGGQRIRRPISLVA